MASAQRVVRDSAFVGVLIGPAKCSVTDYGAVGDGVHNDTAAIQKANGYKLDKSHTFIVNSLNDYYKYAAVPDEEKERTEKGWKGLLLDRIKAMLGGSVLK